MRTAALPADKASIAPAAGMASAASVSIATAKLPLLGLAGDGVAAADAGEHFPKGVENAIDGSRSGRGVMVSDVLREHRALGGGVLAVGFDVDGEILVTARRCHVVVLDQAFDFRFGDGGDLAFVGVERGEAFGSCAFETDGAKGADEVRSLGPFFG